MRQVSDSGCGGPAGIPGDRRHACVSSCIWLCLEHRSPHGVAGPGSCQTGPGSSVSSVSSRGEVLCSAAQGHLSSLSSLGRSGPGIPHSPVLSCPSAVCNHSVAKRGLPVAPMSLTGPWCPYHHHRLFPALALLPSEVRLSLGDPSGDGLGVLTLAR